MALGSKEARARFAQHALTETGDLFWEVPCNAPTGVKGQTLAKEVRLLGKSTGSYGKPAMTRCR